MKCLAVAQPWATLIILGAKRFECRRWETRHRGRLAIHASKLFPESARDLCRQEPWRSLLRRAGFLSWFDLPRGVVLGTVHLAACLPADDIRATLSKPPPSWFDLMAPWIWVLTDPKPLPTPIPARGKMGLFESDFPL